MFSFYSIIFLQTLCFLLKKKIPVPGYSIYETDRITELTGDIDSLGSLAMIDKKIYRLCA